MNFQTYLHNNYIVCVCVGVFEAFVGAGEIIALVITHCVWVCVYLWMRVESAVCSGR